MAEPVGMNAEQVLALANELRRIRGRLRPALRKAVATSATTIRDDARARIVAQSVSGHIKQYPRSITHTVKDSGATLVTAEIGPDKDKSQGPLGNILEYGTSKNPPYPHLQPALDAEADNFEDLIGDAARDAVFE